MNYRIQRNLYFRDEINKNVWCEIRASIPTSGITLEVEHLLNSRIYQENVNLNMIFFCSDAQYHQHHGCAWFLKMNCKNRCISPNEQQKLLHVKKWTHMNTTCTGKNTCERRTRTCLKLMISSSRHAQNYPRRKVKLW